jgi:PIN domain nuclease of toxin-antitoxin system
VKFLLDTCALLAWMDGRLPSKMRRRIQKPGTDVLVSIATPVEIAIKNNPPGRVPLPSPRQLEEALELLQGRWLPVTLDCAEFLYTLPLHHKDPFDRIIIVQALKEDCPVVTSDERFPLYESTGLQVLWD